MNNKFDAIHDFFDLSLDLLLIIDFKGDIKKINKSCTNLLGFSESDILAQNKSLIHPEDFSNLSHLLSKVNKGKKISDFEIRIKKKNEEFIWTQ